MTKKEWIQKAIKKKGGFTKQAKKAGMTVQRYASKIVKGDGKRYGIKTLKRAILAKTLKKIASKK